MCLTGIKEDAVSIASAIKNASITQIFLAVVLAFGLGCAEDKPPAPAIDVINTTLRIVFSWPGDDLATRQELEIRDRIARQIALEGIGEIIRSGTGMGWMDLVVAVKEREIARRQIEQIVRAQSPDLVFTIQASNLRP